MAKRRRTTGIPHDRAVVGATLPHLRDYRGWQCKDCALDATCDPNTPPGGPWEVVEAQPERAVACLVHPNIRMVPVAVVRVKEERVVVEAPREPKREEWNVLLDANAIIEGAKGTFPGLLDLIVRPPAGFRYFTVASVAAEIRWLPGQDKDSILAALTVVPDPSVIDRRLAETSGEGINPPSGADMALFQVAKDDERFSILVSHDRYMRWTGLPQTLGIGDRLKVYAVDDYVRFAKKKR